MLPCDIHLYFKFDKNAFFSSVKTDLKCISKHFIILFLFTGRICAYLNTTNCVTMSQYLENGHTEADNSCSTRLKVNEVNCDTAEDITNSTNGGEGTNNNVSNGLLHFDRDKLVQITFEMSIMKPFEEQIAGHGTKDGEVRVYFSAP